MRHGTRRAPGGHACPARRQPRTSQCRPSTAGPESADEADPDACVGVVSIKVDNAVQAAGLLHGRHAAGLTALTAHEVVIDADGPEAQAGVDGEALSFRTPVRCVISPRALRVRVPRHRPRVSRPRSRLDRRRLRDLALSRG